MSTQSRRGKLKRQDTPINVDSRERVNKSDFIKKSFSRRSRSSLSSQRTSSCDERQHSPKCPQSLTDQQSKGIKTAVCAVSSNPSSSASSAPRYCTHCAWIRIVTSYIAALSAAWTWLTRMILRRRSKFPWMNLQSL